MPNKVAMRYGTPSESGGASSGIVSGADFIKFPDGTMIQWGKVSITAGASASGSAVWTFPEPFIDSDYVCTATAAVGTMVQSRSRVIVSSYQTDNITVYWRNESTSSYTMTVACIAVGRWK